jgi:hypothetical protein
MDYLVVSSWINLHVEKNMTIDIFLIFCHDILAMMLFRILTKSNGAHVLVFYLQNKNRAFFMTNLDIVNFGARLPYNVF